VLNFGDVILITVSVIVNSIMLSIQTVKYVLSNIRLWIDYCEVWVPVTFYVISLLCLTVFSIVFCTSHGSAMLRVQQLKGSQTPIDND